MCTIERFQKVVVEISDGIIENESGKVQDFLKAISSASESTVTLSARIDGKPIALKYSEIKRVLEQKIRRSTIEISTAYR